MKHLVSRCYIFTTAVILIVVGIGAHNNPKSTVKTDYQLTPMTESTFFVAHQWSSSSTRTTTISVMHFLLILTEGVEESPIFHCLQFISVDGFLIDEKRQRGVLNLVIDALDSRQNGPGLSTEVFKLESWTLTRQASLDPSCPLTPFDLGLIPLGALYRSVLLADFSSDCPFSVFLLMFFCHLTVITGKH